MIETSNAPQATAKSLAAPFAANEVRLKPGAVSGNRALAMPYIDARTVMDRLDTVLGMDAWKDAYEPLADGTVLCRLSCRIADAWIEKQDVGAPSEQKDAGDRRKAAFSDALKRAAVKFGVGRYLYQTPAAWRDFDPRTKRFATADTPPSRNGHVMAAPPAARNGHAVPAPPTVQVDEYGYPIQW